MESSWGACSDDAISFSIQPFPGERCIFWIYLKKTESYRVKRQMWKSLNTNETDFTEYIPS
jgi:hypothetical protein